MATVIDASRKAIRNLRMSSTPKCGRCPAAALQTLTKLGKTVK